MPTSQSLSLRQTAASASGTMSLSARSLAKPIADGVRCHALQPEAPGRLLVARQLHEIVENQLTLAAGRRSVDDFVDIRALQEPLDEIEPRLRLLDRLRSKCSGMIGKLAKLHLPRFLSRFTRQAQFDQMADRRGDDVFFILEKSSFLGIFPSARARSAATLGFSAITRAFGIGNF